MVMPSSMLVPQMVPEILRKPLAAAVAEVIGTITHVTTPDPVAALTFDDGPHPESTPHLLEILEKNHVRATFFMLGEAAQKYPELVQWIAQGGHAIGNHSWDHPSFPLISGRVRRRQIRACSKALAPYEERLFRPPYGHQSVASRLDALCLGYQVVTWNIAAYDWLDHDADWIVRRLVDQVHPGSVILFHDRLFNAPETRFFDRGAMIQAVNNFLEHVRSRLHFITIPELLRHGRPHRQNWYWRPNVDWLSKLKEQDGAARRYSRAIAKCGWVS